VVLETFGAGNAPQRKDLMSTLHEACERGVVIVAITQCAKGSVSNAYETGRTLLQAGIIPGGDMTPEVSTPIFLKRARRRRNKYRMSVRLVL
jgi:lysophospholipase